MPCDGKQCSVLLCSLFISEVLSCLDGGNAPIVGLSLLIGEINGDNANNGLCAFEVLQVP